MSSRTLPGRAGWLSSLRFWLARETPWPWLPWLNRRVRSSKEQIARALVGDYRPEHLFALQTAYDMYLAYEGKIRQCDDRLINELEKLPDKVDVKLKPLPPVDEKKQ